MTAATYCPANGKLQFRSQHQAAHQLRKWGNGGTIYRCEHCHAWHVSRASLDQRKGKRLRHAREREREMES